MCCSYLTLKLVSFNHVVSCDQQVTFPAITKIKTFWNYFDSLHNNSLKMGMVILYIVILPSQQRLWGRGRLRSYGQRERGVQFHPFSWWPIIEKYQTQLQSSFPQNSVTEINAKIILKKQISWWWGLISPSNLDYLLFIILPPLLVLVVAGWLGLLCLGRCLLLIRLLLKHGLLVVDGAQETQDLPIHLYHTAQE